jgi:preprotein translocase subunit SecG
MIGLIGALLVIVCLVLIITVMVQNPKGGGLSSTFGGGNQILGVQKTTNFIEKTTWTLAIALVALVLASHYFVPSPKNMGPQIDSEILEDAQTQVPQPDASAAPAETPATNTEGTTNPVKTEEEAK